MAVNVMLVSSVDYNLSKAEILRAIVADKLTAAAQEILAVVERTLAGYEEETSALREENERQRRLLELLLQPRVTLCRTDEPAWEEKEESSGGREPRPKEKEEEEQATVYTRTAETISPVKDVEDPGSPDSCDLAEEEEGEADEVERSTDLDQEAAQSSGLDQEAAQSSGLDQEAAQSSGLDQEAAQSSGLDQEAAQSSGLDQEALTEPGKHLPDTRLSGRTKKRRLRKALTLRVCLLKDSQTRTLLKGVLKSPMKQLQVPRGLQEADFLDLLRSTFPQLIGPFEAFTVDASRKLTPLAAQALTPEEIRRSITSTGKGWSALYVRVKAAKTSLTSTEQQREQEAAGDAGSDVNREDYGSSNNSPVGRVESDEAAGPSCRSRQPKKKTETEEQRQPGTSEEEDAAAALSSAADSERDDRDDDDDDGDWKPGKHDEKEPQESEAVERRGRRKALRVKNKPKRPRSDRGGPPMSCKVCHALSRWTSMLIKHAVSHVDEPDRLCGVCGQRSESAEDLRSHLQSHQETHSCDVCGKAFLHAIALRQHAGVHTGERPHKCDVCGKAYTLKSSLNTHRFQHMEKPHKCDVCGQSFSSKFLLRTHAAKHTGEKLFCCDMCGQSFNHFRALSLHKMAHVGDGRYSCPDCGRRFLTPGKMRDHAKIHTDRTRSHLCDVCCKAFHTGPQLAVHMKTHGEEKTVCGKCGKGLSSLGALTRHMRIHTGERPYECSKCGRTFKCMSTLRAHEKTQHSGVKPFVCTVCGKACARKEYLNVHMRTHNGDRPYKCTLCDRAFTQSHCLKTHMKNSHQHEAESAVDALQS